MGCFVVPAVGAVISHVASKCVHKKQDSSSQCSFSRKLGWLTKLLAGGSILLAFEHVWHGEVVAWFPFLTAMNDPNDAAEMFHEMSTVGVTMLLVCLAVWAVMLLVARSVEVRSAVKEH